MPDLLPSRCLYGKSTQHGTLDLSVSGGQMATMPISPPRGRPNKGTAGDGLSILADNAGVATESTIKKALKRISIIPWFAWLTVGL